MRGSREGLAVGGKQRQRRKHGDVAASCGVALGENGHAENEISRRLDALPAIVQSEGYPDVQAFTTTYRKAEAVVDQYNRELAEWERIVEERQRPAKSDPPR